MPLKFMCPVTGIEVDTGFELDGRSFASLPREITVLSCPHCKKPHLLAGVSAWLGELNRRSSTFQPISNPSNRGVVSYFEGES